MFKTTVAAEPTVCQDRVTFDHAGRLMQTSANDKTGSSTNADEDVITDFVYNADGQISTMTARNSLTGDQTTRYVYGTDLAATPVVYRNDLLRAEIYPDSDDTTSLGNGADGVFDRVEYMQNRQGEVIQKKNQNGSVHTYDYDLLGRLEHDRVLTVGVGVDNAVRRISTSYTKLGLPFQITSYSSATVGAGTVLNQIERTYFGFGQLVNEYQALTGAKDGTTPWVGYSYDSTARGLRPLAVRYPNGRQAYTTYGATESVADKINRIDAINDDNGGVPGSVLAQYTYLGRGTIVSVNSPTPTLTLDLIGSGTAYAGFDRFLRVVDQRWKGPGGADLDRYQHGYDQASNRTFRDNLTTSLQDEYYTYDGLQRLKNFDRGDLNAGRTGITGTPVREEDWTLDRTGNWPGYVVKASGTTSLNQTRGHNPANEITLLTATVGTVWAATAHDRNGNMTSLPKPASLGTALTCKYDAWNRLMEIKEGTTVLGAYKYDGLMRRIEKVAGGSTTRYYHSNQWQVLEERVDSTTLPRAQYVWGPRYVDDLIVRDRDSSAPFDGVLNERLYYLQDANWNVTALVSTAGVVQERYAYEPYGGLLVFNGSWSSIGTSALANSYAFTGRQLDAESGIYYYRYRYYHAQLGRFVGRDPLGYADGMNLNGAYFAHRTVDPFGLFVPERCNWDDPNPERSDCCWALGHDDRTVAIDEIRAEAKSLYRQAMSGAITSCEAMARLFDFAAPKYRCRWSDNSDQFLLDVASVLSGTSWGFGTDGTQPRFNDSGFKVEFQDGSNQVQHFAAGVVTGCRYSVLAHLGHRFLRPDDPQDTALNDVSTALGSCMCDNTNCNLCLSDVGNWIRANVCGGPTSNGAPAPPLFPD